jgi:hypothetical protein
MITHPPQKYPLRIDSRSDWYRVSFTSLDFRKVVRSEAVRLSYDLNSSSLIPGSYLTALREYATVKINVVVGPIKTATSSDLRRRLLIEHLSEQLVLGDGYAKPLSQVTNSAGQTHSIPWLVKLTTVKRGYRNVGIVGHQNTFSGKYCKLTGQLREGGVLIGSEEKRLALVQDRGLPETIPASLLRNFCVTEFGVLTDFSVFGVSCFQ